MKKRYLLQLLDDDPRRVYKLVRLLKKRDIAITSIIISIEINNDPRTQGVLGGIKRNYEVILFEGILPVPIVRGRYEKVKWPETLYYNAWKL